MAKMKSRFKRRLMNIAKVGGKSIQTGRKIETTARNPVGSILDTSAKILKKWGNGPKRRGAVRGKIQYINPKTGKWTKKDLKTGRTVGAKKTYGPYKSVRKGRRKRR